MLKVVTLMEVQVKSVVVSSKEIIYLVIYLWFQNGSFVIKLATSPHVDKYETKALGTIFFLA